jgi:cytidylate kinase
MPIIAMTREMGTRGREIAEQLAGEMGLTVILHELVERDIAERLQLPEGTIHRRLEGGASLRERLRVGAARLARHTAEEVLELAQAGNVLIRGWGACVLLRGVPHVARVRVCAPMALRERNVMVRQGLADRAAARRLIEDNDAAHRRALAAAYGVDREDARLYDVVLNTERLSIGACVGLIRGLMGCDELRETEASRAILGDKVLEARARSKLAERFTAGTGVSDIVATATAGRVVLTGLAVQSALAEEAAAIVAAIPGVTGVDNRIHVVRGPRGL